MSNFFSFERDMEETHVNPDITFKTFGGTPWFSIYGESAPTPYPLSIDGTSFTIPKGRYEISINRELKGEKDSLILAMSGDMFTIHKDPITISVEKQTKAIFAIWFGDTTDYLYGDYYDAQHDYGKDYEIRVNVLSGGIFERVPFFAQLKGDLDRNGVINNEDLSLMYLFRNRVPVDIDEENADINGDDEVNYEDIRELESYLSGKRFFW